MTRARVKQAYPGSLNRRVRDAACARSSGVHPFFCSLLHWSSRRSARGRNFGWSRTPVLIHTRTLHS